MAEKEYIERDAFKAEIRRLSTHYLNEWDTLGVLAAADRIPAADVREVKRGKWKKMLQNADGTSDYECSACAGLILDVPDDDEHPLCRFCPNCGADMREEVMRSD